MAPPLSEQVIVITGASSGIGRETARRFAQAGAAVVLAARNEQGLETVAQEIRRAGGRCHVVPTDVSSWEQVEMLAQEAVATYGRIDTWVNDAGVSIYATVEDTTPEEFEQLMRVNVYGTFHGSKAALNHMRVQGTGTIINIGSAMSARSLPLQSAYSASKHAVKGFTEALRMELRRDHPGINVTLILPASVNTPFFNHARSKMGVKPQPIPPVYHPKLIADAVVYAAEHARRDMHVGGASWMFVVLQRLSPALGDRVMKIGDWIWKQQKTDEPDDGRDALFSPVYESGRVHGDFAHLTKPSLYGRLVEMMPNWTRVAVPTAAAAALVLLRRRG